MRIWLHQTNFMSLFEVSESMSHGCSICQADNSGDDSPSDFFVAYRYNNCIKVAVSVGHSFTQVVVARVYLAQSDGPLSHPLQTSILPSLSDLPSPRPMAAAEHDQLGHTADSPRSHCSQHLTGGTADSGWGGENLLRPYSQQRPMGTNLS